MIRALLVGLIVSVIVVISPPHASAEGGKCAAAGRDIYNFRATLPPHRVREVPFIDGANAVRTIAAYRGKGVVLNFWATWCAPCVREMPSLDRLQATVADEGIVVLTVSEDRGGAPVIRKFFSKHGIKTLPVLTDKGGKMFLRLGGRGLPTTLLIDDRGNEVGRVVGAAEWDSPQLLALVRGCVAPRPAAGGQAAERS